jgi:predicted GIY-YIG superfamily endonuclease
MYLYIIKVQKPSRKCFYVGITNDIKRRYKQHLMGIGSKWAKRYFKGAKKVLAFVGYMPYGVLWAAMEKKVKSLPPRKKEDMVLSKYNILDEFKVDTRMWDVDVNVKLKSITNENMLRNLDGI